MLDLSGLWHLTDETGQYTAPMPIPGDGVSALLAAKVIADPYVGQNEYDTRWVGERDWVLKREFDTDDTAQSLVVEMLDTVAEVSINGHLILTSDTMFRTHRADATNALRKGRNIISILFRSASREADKRQAAQPFPVPYQAANCPIANGNMLRKPECDFGWDWNIALAPFGVYGAIGLAPNTGRISDVIVTQLHDDEAVIVQVQAHTADLPDGTPVSFEFDTQSVDAIVTGSAAQATFQIENPELWWPVGLGEQSLYSLTVKAGADTQTRRIGLRKVELINTVDTKGAGFAFHINGHPTFMKGANWIPADALASNITPDLCRDLLQSAVDANMNMIRVWGGGRYEPDWFYDLCDEMGLLVWQDFMFACHLYPATEGFLTEVSHEVREQVARLQHHACIVLWCGDNELLGALTWYEESRTNRDRYLVAYDRLNRTIETALKATDGTAIWWPSSPSPGLLSFGDAWHDDSSGDMHFWSVWHEGRDFDHYRDVSPRFCSEFGFQSYPSMDVIRRFADPKDFNIAAPVMESHQKNAGGNARIAETMFRYFRFPVDFENFVYLSQVQQGLAIKTAVTHWRSLKPHCMGTLYWQLNDTWPVCSWSSLDHGGGWKLLHHMARNFYAPITVCAIPDDTEITLKAVNDTRDATGVQISAHAVNMAGQTRPLGSTTLNLQANGATSVLHFEKDVLLEDEMLCFEWTDASGISGRDHFAPKPYKSYPLRNPNLRHEVQRAGSGWDITLNVDNFALFVALETDIPGRFSQNAVCILPEHPVTIHFTPQDPDAVPDFRLRDLYSATYDT